MSRDESHAMVVCVRNMTAWEELHVGATATPRGIPCATLDDALQHPGSPSLDHVRITLLSLILCCSLSINTLAAAIFYRRPALLSVSNRFVLNLIIANIAMTVYVMPVLLVTTVMNGWFLGAMFCDVTGAVVIVLLCACIFTLLGISMDRYYAIVRPLHYPIRLTKRRSLFYIGMIWACATVIGVAPLFGVGTVRYSEDMRLCVLDWRDRSNTTRAYTCFLSIVCILVPFTVMLWVYVVVCRVAHKTCERARRYSVSQDSVIFKNKMTEVLDMHQQQSLLRRNPRRSSSVRSLFSFHREDWRATKTSLICMSTFSLCWLPFFVLITMRASPVGVAVVPAWAESGVLYSALAGCVLNPMVYVFRSRPVLRECRILLKRGGGAGSLRIPRDITSSSQNGTPLTHMTPNRSFLIFRYSSEDRASFSIEYTDRTDIKADSPIHLDTDSVAEL